MSISAIEYESAVLDRIVVPVESAHAIMTLRFSPDDERRMRELMDRNNEGTITTEEQAEMESFRRVGTFLAILKARARLRLRDGGNSLAS